MKKDVFVVFTENQSDASLAEEKLRMALGMTLNDDNAVKLLFLGRGRSTLKGEGGNTAKHLNMLFQLKASFFVEGSDVETLETLDTETIEKTDVDALLNSADVVVH